MFRLPKTKFLPPQPHQKRMHRPQLEQCLRDLLPQSRIILICAPAGYGKTSLLACLPALFPENKPAWFSLDTEDNDPVRFLAGLGEALGEINPRFRDELTALLAASTGVPGSSLEEILLRQGMVTLINSFAGQDFNEIILVLDDLHAVENPAIYAALDYFIDKLPAGLHLVISSRSDPPLQIARLIARRQALTLRLEDMRFSLEESRRFLTEILNLTPSEEDVQALYARTEGWPVGLVLLTSRRTASAAAGPSPVVVDAASFHYLAEEVLAQQPEEIRDFLLETSILEELTPAICRQVTGRENCEALLAEIHQRNLFLWQEQTGNAEGESLYRMHALFAEVLRYGFGLLPPERRQRLLLRAAEAVTDPGRQISYYLAAGAWEPASTVIEDCGEQFLENGYQQTVASWIQALPEAMPLQRPRLAYVCGLTNLLRGNFESALFNLEKALSSVDMRTKAAALVYLASLAFIRAEFKRSAELISLAESIDPSVQERVDFLMLRASVALFYRQDWANSEADLRSAFASVRRQQNTRQWFLVSLYLAPEFSILPGGLDLVEDFCKEAEKRFHNQDTPLRLGVTDTLASLHLQRGRLQQALEYSREALFIKEHLGGYAFLGINAALTAAAALTALGNYSAAQEYAQLTLAQAGEAELNQALSGGGWYPWGRLMCLQNRFAEAEQAYQRLAALEYRLPLADSLQKILSGLIDLLTKHYASAEQTLHEAAKLQTAERVSRMYASANLLLAVLYERCEQPQAALAALQDALSQDGEGAVLREMPLAAPVLRLALRSGVCSDQVARLLQLAGLSTAEDSAQNTLLTGRQLEILRLMAAGYSNQAIADQLVISLATVKSHVVNIMNRLGVSSRMEAVAQARQTGLL